MQNLQKKYKDKNVVWPSIVSSAIGKQGYVDQSAAKKEQEKHKSSASDILRDSSGKVGQAYGAKTTPHMYIIDKKGALVYQGAIDSLIQTCYPSKVPKTMSQKLWMS